MNNMLTAAMESSSHLYGTLFLGLRELSELFPACRRLASKRRGKLPKDL